MMPGSTCRRVSMQHATIRATYMQPAHNVVMQHATVTCKCHMLQLRACRCVHAACYCYPCNVLQVAWLHIICIWCRLYPWHGMATHNAQRRWCLVPEKKFSAMMILRQVWHIAGPASLTAALPLAALLCMLLLPLLLLHHRRRTRTPR
jgi:hypothetical protein